MILRTLKYGFSHLLTTSMQVRRRQWQPTLVFLPGESQGRLSLVGCHLWGRTEPGTTEVTQQQQQQQEETGSPTSRSYILALENLCSDCYIRKINFHFVSLFHSSLICILLLTQLFAVESVACGLIGIEV